MSDGNEGRADALVSGWLYICEEHDDRVFLSVPQRVELVERIEAALSAARESALREAWIPVSQPPTEIVQAVVAWHHDADQCRAWWNGAAWFSDEPPQGMFEPQPDLYFVIPAPPPPPTKGTSDVEK